MQVIQEMFDKAFSNTTMDYELIFWGYTFAIKKITWFAQVDNFQLLNFNGYLQAIEDFAECAIDDKKTLLLQNLDPMFNIKSARFFQERNIFPKNPEIFSLSRGPRGTCPSSSPTSACSTRGTST